MQFKHNTKMNEAKRPSASDLLDLLHETSRLREVAEKLLEFAAAHLLWEFDIIIWNPACHSLHLPLDLATQMVQLQRMRTAALTSLMRGDVQ